MRVDFKEDETLQHRIPMAENMGLGDYCTTLSSKTCAASPPVMKSELAETVLHLLFPFWLPCPAFSPARNSRYP